LLKLSIRLMSAALVLAVAGCTAHEVYEKSDLVPEAADRDWAACEARALAAAGVAVDAQSLRGRTSVSGQRLVGAMATLNVGNGTMYSPEDYLKIRRRQETLKDCMQSKGYQFIGVPAVEAL
jgi:hypothetical protein